MRPWPIPSAADAVTSPSPAGSSDTWPGGGRPALIAAAIGVLLRCLSRRKGGFDGRGRVKASWIAKAFGVDARAVKAARKELVALGWIAPVPSGQLAENRWGRAYRIDLAWAAPGPPAVPGTDVADRHPPPGFGLSHFATPSSSPGTLAGAAKKPGTRPRRAGWG